MPGWLYTLLLVASIKYNLLAKDHGKIGMPSTFCFGRLGKQSGDTGKDGCWRSSDILVSLHDVGDMRDIYKQYFKIS